MPIGFGSKTYIDHNGHFKDVHRQLANKLDEGSDAARFNGKGIYVKSKVRNPDWNTGREERYAQALNHYKEAINRAYGDVTEIGKDGTRQKIGDFIFTKLGNPSKLDFATFTSVDRELLKLKAEWGARASKDAKNALHPRSDLAGHFRREDYKTLLHQAAAGNPKSGVRLAQNGNKVVLARDEMRRALVEAIAERYPAIRHNRTLYSDALHHADHLLGMLGDHGWDGLTVANVSRLVELRQPGTTDSAFATLLSQACEPIKYQAASAHLASIRETMIETAPSVAQHLDNEQLSMMRDGLVQLERDTQAFLKDYKELQNLPGYAGHPLRARAFQRGLEAFQGARIVANYLRSLDPPNDKVRLRYAAELDAHAGEVYDLTMGLFNAPGRVDQKEMPVLHDMDELLLQSTLHNTFEDDYAITMPADKSYSVALTEKVRMPSGLYFKKAKKWLPDSVQKDKQPLLEMQKRISMYNPVLAKLRAAKSDFESTSRMVAQLSHVVDTVAENRRPTDAEVAAMNDRLYAHGLDPHSEDGRAYLAVEADRFTGAEKADVLHELRQIGITLNAEVETALTNAKYKSEFKSFLGQLSDKALDRLSKTADKASVLNDLTTGAISKMSARHELRASKKRSRMYSLMVRMFGPDSRLKEIRDNHNIELDRLMRQRTAIQDIRVKVAHANAQRNASPALVKHLHVVDQLAHQARRAGAIEDLEPSKYNQPVQRPQQNHNDIQEESAAAGDSMHSILGDMERQGDDAFDKLQEAWGQHKKPGHISPDRYDDPFSLDRRAASMSALDAEIESYPEAAPRHQFGVQGQPHVHPNEPWAVLNDDVFDEAKYAKIDDDLPSLPGSIDDSNQVFDDEAVRLDEHLNDAPLNDDSVGLGRHIVGDWPRGTRGLSIGSASSQAAPNAFQASAVEELNQDFDLDDEDGVNSEPYDDVAQSYGLAATSHDKAPPTGLFQPTPPRKGPGLGDDAISPPISDVWNRNQQTLMRFLSEHFENLIATLPNDMQLRSELATALKDVVANRDGALEEARGPLNRVVDWATTQKNNIWQASCAEAQANNAAQIPLNEALQYSHVLTAASDALMTLEEIIEERAVDALLEDGNDDDHVNNSDDEVHSANSDRDPSRGQPAER